MSARTRRQFLAGTAAALAAAAAGGGTRAVEPVKRTGGPRLKLSLCAYSYRDYLTGKRTPAMDLSEFVRRSAEMPLDGVELTSYYFPKETTTATLAALKRECCLLGLDVSGTAVGNTFTFPAGPKRDEQLALVRLWIERGAALGASTIRIFAGNPQPGQSPAEAQRCCIESIEACVDLAAEKGVLLALENHGGIVAEAAGVLEIMRAVKSDWVGVNLDTGNFHTADPYAEMARVAPYAVTAHFKTEVTAAGRPKGPADYRRIVQILMDVGYRGYLALEYEAAEEPLQAVPRAIAELRALV